MVKKLPTKSEQSDEMAREMRNFLKRGGKVDQVPRGTSGKEPGDPPTYLAKRLFQQPPEARTFVPEVVAAIEARRREKLKRTQRPKRAGLRTPRRKIIYDDFGEPLRRVWVDE